MERRKEKSGGRRIEPCRDKEQAARPLCKVGGGKQKESTPLREERREGPKCILDPYCEQRHDPINCAAFVELHLAHQLAMAEARGHCKRCFNIIGAGCGSRNPCTPHEGWRSRDRPGPGGFLPEKIPKLTVREGFDNFLGLMSVNLVRREVEAVCKVNSLQVLMDVEAEDTIVTGSVKKIV
jgi:hypothetical protein